MMESAEMGRRTAQAEEMLPLLKRHEIQVLLRAGHSQKDVAARTGASSQAHGASKSSFSQGHGATLSQYEGATGEGGLRGFSQAHGATPDPFFAGSWGHPE